MDKVMVALHVVAAVFLIGPMAVLPMAGLKALRTGNAGQVASLASSTQLYSRLSLVVVLLGFGVLGMVDKTDRNWSYGSLWIWLSIVLWVVAVVLTEAVVVPKMRAAIGISRGSESNDPRGDAAVDRGQYSSIAIANGIASVLLVVVIVLMVVKPG